MQPEAGVWEAGPGEDRDAAPLRHGEHFWNYLDQPLSFMLATVLTYHAYFIASLHYYLSRIKTQRVQTLRDHISDS